MTKSLHDELMIIDGLQHSRWDREVFEEMRRGGVTAVHVTTAVWEGCRDALSNIIHFHRYFEEHGDIIFQARTVDDIRMAKKIGKTAIILGFQNSSPIEDDIGLVQVFHELGVRVMQLTYNNQSLLGSSCYEATDTGIPRFGREVIREANRLGMIIDVSHCGERTGQDAIDISERPIAITHAIPKFFHPGIRNKSDGLLRNLAKSGGMLGFSLYPFHIGGKDTQLSKFCEMVARTVDLMGVDHVGIGSDHSRKWVDADLDWIRSGRWKKGTDFGEGSPTNRSWPEWPEWFRTPAQFGNLTDGLVKQGFGRADVAKIMGENWLRFFEDGFGPAKTPAKTEAKKG